LALLAILFFSPGDNLRSQDSPRAPLRVLFIGNSLTYSNDLPSIVEALAEATGKRPLAFRTIVSGGYSLEDHWQRGEAQRAIRGGGWDVVVLQQGPSASIEGRRLLLEYAGRFSREIRRSGARTALYMVWPSLDRAGDFGRAAESYRLAAEETKGLLLPAGEAWLEAGKREPKLSLYSPDGLHPTLLGSLLAALVIYERLYGEAFQGEASVLKLRSGALIQIPGEQMKLLREAAAEANRKFGPPRR
jgi:hypothetical protein